MASGPIYEKFFQSYQVDFDGLEASVRTVFSAGGVGVESLAKQARQEFL